MKKLHIAEISVAAAMIVSIVFSLVSFEKNCSDIRNDVVRLHILANSDSDEDQAVKLAVRDALLASGNEIFDGILSAKNAQQLIEENAELLEETANSVLSERGFDYTASVMLVKEYFNTRVYENFTMPAGKYSALKIVLGKGEGHNWWCVMFPPLCLPAASENSVESFEFSNGELKVLESEPKYEVRFAVVELIEQIKSRLRA